MCSIRCYRCRVIYVADTDTMGKNVGIPHDLRALNVQVHIKQVNVVQTSRNVQTVYTAIRNKRQTTTSTTKQQIMKDAKFSKPW